MIGFKNISYCTQKCLQSKLSDAGVFSLFCCNRYHNRRLSSGKYEEKDHAKVYSKYRPTYPDKVYRTVVDFYTEVTGNTKKSFELAVDIGCGNGQSTLPLCKYFKHVIGYDVSAQQIAHADLTSYNNVTFKVGPAEILSFLDNCSVDLITSFQAMHWFDLGKFYKEVNRVLKTRGVFAAYGYDVCYLDRQQANEEFEKFYRDIVRPHLSPPSLLCYEQRYRTLPFLFQHAVRIENDEISIKRRMQVDAFVGFLSSMASWQNYLQLHPSNDVLDNFKNKLLGVYQNDLVEVFWPGFLLMGQQHKF